MKRTLTALCVLVLAVGCRSGSGSCGLQPKHSAPTAQAGRPKPPRVAALEAKHGRPLRVAHAVAIGSLRGIDWSEDERLLAVWSESAALVFDVRTERVLHGVGRRGRRRSSL
ncbi:MAG: hypothetical protein JW940_12300 [Polyangiaceae bacterium]|nr:hypothetical protein [Polyangiaceae bacterium]